MNVQAIVPCLWMDDQAQTAAALYTSVFPGGSIQATAYYPNEGTNPAGRPAGSILTVDFEIAGMRFTALNGGPMFKIGPSISFFFHAESPEQAASIFTSLAQGGNVFMPLDAYPWSPCYGWVGDRFGVPWQIITGRPPRGQARIVPCLMFSDAQRGRAHEAIEAYTGIFPESSVQALEHYAESEGPQEYIKHGRFALAGQDFVAMDSHIPHGFAFNEGISLQIMCADQSEVDRYWNELTKGGAEEPCGWLKDAFGVSWQVVPRSIAQWMNHPDPQARDRGFAAMMRMSKPDIAALEAAMRG
jgi:predicted 3-demethylubiquinone-9 3-methyltransferase (glyoxalase superfamily)